MQTGSRDHHTPDDFCRNLRLACSFHPSIAQVCRRLDLNRAQFNKYLSGAARPSAHTLLRIGDFFGLESHEMLLPHSRFAQLLSLRPARPARPTEADDPLARHLEGLRRRSRGSLDKYLGYYFEYYHSMAFPGYVLRSLFVLYRQGDDVCYRRMERLSHLGQPASGFRCRYLGVALLLNERIILIDYESLTSNEVTETILYPTYKSRVNSLTGLKIGVSAADRREPACARVVLQFLGQRIHVRGALRQCGLLSPDPALIGADVLSRIDNRGTDGQHHFLGLPY
ncbi:helix-turn-helix domain-containing protein [Hydrogenophaga sp. NFH-34]|uniref:helix-turn-helix domain-containing protein n=1 Tax=Hydrogenophaga sp. NFH-34 TaxID=2744446 RepID=UPI001F30A7C6|nr:helix-turn-helix transcriptional regulator [Hydrogenophaga sp. NFH-34]